MGDLLLSTTILASFLGGVVALLAPCCVSVMLPAYLASAFRQRSRIVAMTLVFAVGVATVILPIALGASALSRLFVGYHEVVFSVGGAAMVIGGLAMLAGWKFSLPMPGARGRTGTSVWSVYSLGAFSGIASACCAPVLAGVITISGVTSSFPTALAVGLAYVFGMVAPLAVFAVVWERRRWDAGRLARRTVTIRLGKFRRGVPLGIFVSGLLLVAMGLLTLALALSGPGMATGWQLTLTSWLDHARAVTLAALDWLPGGIATFLVAGALIGFLVLAARSRRGHHPAETPPPSPDTEQHRDPETTR